MNMNKNKENSGRSGGLTAKKAENFSEWYTQVIEKAEIVDLRLGIKGFRTLGMIQKD